MCTIVNKILKETAGTRLQPCYTGAGFVCELEHSTQRLVRPSAHASIACLTKLWDSLCLI